MPLGIFFAAAFQESHNMCYTREVAVDNARGVFSIRSQLMTVVTLRKVSIRYSSPTCKARGYKGTLPKLKHTRASNVAHNPTFTV